MKKPEGRSVNQHSNEFLFSLHLSDEENRSVYGKCNNPNGHGHNYKGQFGSCVHGIYVAPHLLV